MPIEIKTEEHGSEMKVTSIKALYHKELPKEYLYTGPSCYKLTRSNEFIVHPPHLPGQLPKSVYRIKEGGTYDAQTIQQILDITKQCEQRLLRIKYEL